MKFDATSMRARAGSMFDGFSRGQKTMLALVGVGVIVAALMFSRMSSTPSWSVLYGDLPAAEAAKVTEELNSMGSSTASPTAVRRSRCRATRCTSCAST